MLSGFLCRSCVEVEFEGLCSFWTKQDISRMQGIIREVINGKECLSAEMRAWKLAGHPVVGYWVHVGDLQPTKWPVGLGLRVGRTTISGLGNYVTVPQTALARPEWCSPP